MFLLRSLIRAKFIPQLIQMYKSGDFPVNELCKTYPVSEIQQSIEDMKSGQVCLKSYDILTDIR